MARSKKIKVELVLDQFNNPIVEKTFIKPYSHLDIRLEVLAPARLAIVAGGLLMAGVSVLLLPDWQVVTASSLFGGGLIGIAALILAYRSYAERSISEVIESPMTREVEYTVAERNTTAETLDDNRWRASDYLAVQLPNGINVPAHDIQKIHVNFTELDNKITRNWAMAELSIVTNGDNYKSFCEGMERAGYMQFDGSNRLLTPEFFDNTLRVRTYGNSRVVNSPTPDDDGIDFGL